MSVLDNRPALKAEVEKVAEVAGYLWEKGWAERNGGNITVNITDCVDGAEQPSDKTVNTMSHNERNRRASASMADRQNQSLYPPCTRRTMWVAIILLVVIVAAGIWAFYSILG